MGLGFRVQGLGQVKILTWVNNIKEHSKRSPRRVSAL